MEKEEEKRVAEQGRKMKELAREQIRSVIDAKKEQLAKAEDSMHSLEQGDKTKGRDNIDSLRKIGGGLAGVNYGAGGTKGTKEAEEKEKLQAAKDTVQQLKLAVRELEKNNRPSTFDLNDPSYS